MNQSSQPREFQKKEKFEETFLINSDEDVSCTQNDFDGNPLPKSKYTHKLNKLKKTIKESAKDIAVCENDLKEKIVSQKLLSEELEFKKIKYEILTSVKLSCRILKQDYTTSRIIRLKELQLLIENVLNPK